MTGVDAAILVAGINCQFIKTDLNQHIVRTSINMDKIIIETDDKCSIGFESQTFSLVKTRIDTE